MQVFIIRQSDNGAELILAKSEIINGRMVYVPVDPTNEKPNPSVPREATTEAEDRQLMSDHVAYSDKALLTLYVEEIDPQSNFETSFMDSAKRMLENNWSVSLKQRLVLIRILSARGFISPTGDPYADDTPEPPRPTPTKPQDDEISF